MHETVNEKQRRADQLEERLVDFAVRIIHLSAGLPKTPAGKHVAGQILRCGTSPAPNYSEARAAESRADFVHKMRVVLKELNETLVWLRMVRKSELITPELLADIIDENSQLCRIVTSSVSTAKARSATQNEK
ncbi:MAG TPA: four helix bundle protein [Terriglobia bacterium]|nr:four helix bundle protein [Terriglobia bacterium]